MKYFLDTEFHEYHKQAHAFSFKIGKPVPTVDLISIGIYAEDGREYYAVSKDFNLKDAWNSYQMKQVSGDQRNRYPDGIKEYWLRENVLKSIWIDLEIQFIREYNPVLWIMNQDDDWKKKIKEEFFTMPRMKMLVEMYGKHNSQIAEEIKEFCSKHLLDSSLTDKNGEVIYQMEADATPKEFYGYYADYDWVVFAQLYGRMMNLPDGFPWYCIDLKQQMRDHINFTEKGLKTHEDYPKQVNEHNALDDAKWNYALYKFLGSI